MKQGEKVPVVWRLIMVGRHVVQEPVEGHPGVAEVKMVDTRPVFDRAEGARGIAILGDKHGDRYWFRTDKFEDVGKLEDVRKMVAAGQEVNAPPAIQSLVEGNSDFAIRMFHQLKGGGGNLFFSPYSMSSALGMTYAGAGGDTAAQMKEALGFPGEADDVCLAFGRLQAGLNAIQNDGNVELSIANAIWAEKNYTFLSEFLKLVGKDYKAKLEQADFVKNFEAERKKINAWVEEITHDKITDLIPQGVLDALTRMVLVNAIYFKGDWASQFDKKHTRDREFHVSPDEKVTVPMMFQKGKFRLAEDAGTQALELPYNGDRLSMLVLLPKGNDGLANLEAGLTREKLNQLLEGLRETEVEVSFPRFKVEAGYDLIAPFKALGMTDAFGNKADFSGMDGTRELYISAILHKAFVEVDEQGTEAAAATAVVVATRSARRNPRFTADHPFLFLIRDTTTGSILFMGRMMNPVQK